MSSKTMVSCFILLVVGLHAIPVVFYQSGRQTTWPILAWSMYAQSYPPGPIVMSQRRLVEITASGRSRVITPGVIGLSGDALRNTYLVPLGAGDSTVASKLMARLNAHSSDSVVELRLETTEYRLLDHGVAVDTLTANVYRAPESAGR